MITNIVLGLALLFFGGEAIVRGAVQVAQRFNVSPLLIGLTLVGFGTSIPELLTSVEAALLNSPGIAIGNVVGSNTANILLILGLAALVAPLPMQRDMLRRDGTVMAVAALTALAVLYMGLLDRTVGLFMVGALVLYIAWAWHAERRQVAEGVYRPQALGAAPVAATVVAGVGPRSTGLAGRLLAPRGAAGGFFAIIGLLMVVLGAHLLVNGALDLSEAMGLSQAIVGVTIVAVGTSLPELATSLIAAWRRQPDVAVGNIVGSNIFNVFGILGVTAMVRPLAVPAEIAMFDIWVMIAATAALLLVGLLWARVGRAAGLALLAGYAAYIALLATNWAGA